MAKIAILIADPILRQQLSSAFSSQGFEPLELWPPAKYRTAAGPSPEAMVVQCSPRQGDFGLDFMRQAHRSGNIVPIIVVAPESSEDLAIQAFRYGARNYFKAPFPLNEIRASVVEASLGDKTAPNSPPENSVLVGLSPAMQEIKMLIRRLAAVNSSVVITGETGTGKELVAQQIHKLSNRSRKPLVCINCAAIPDGLIEGELFGHERGAFTGAEVSRDGKLKEASGGTIFFDEIGDLSPMAQAKILRAIESKEVTPLGGNRNIPLDLRIIAATHRDLEAMAREERFRPDLLFRLNVARIKLPPLRERPTDIPLLIRHFLPQLNKGFGCQMQNFSDGALCRLMAYHWPGNVRELRNILELIFLNLSGRKLHEIGEQHLPDNLSPGGLHPGLATAAIGDEREQLVSVLLMTRWNVSEAARRLRWSRMTLYRKLAKHGICRSGSGYSESADVTPCDIA